MSRTDKQFAGMIVLLLLLTIGMPAQKALAQYDNAYISYNDFYQNLAPYGQWIDDPKLGYVWSPDVDGSFRPYYTNGHWAMTDYGNTWLSDYPWGWACFHYGRWTYDSYYGWLWIPGNYWGPAWVSWRYTDGFYGWAPLGPGYDFDDSYSDYMCPNDWWVFIPYQYLFSGDYYRYWYGAGSNTAILTHSYFVNNVYENNHVHYVYGPHTHDIENVTHQPVQVFHLRNSRNLHTRVHNTEIRMYRPSEIRPYGNNGDVRATPPNMVAAPQPIRSAEAVNTGQATPPRFRHDMPDNMRKHETPGDNINRTAEPAKPTPRYDNNPYEWDVNRSVPQPKQAPANENRREEAPRQQPAPRRQQPPSAPRPQAQPPKPAPQPRQAPAQPAPAQPRQGGRR